MTDLYFFFSSSPLIQVAGLVTRTLLHKDSIDQFVEFRIWRGKPYWRLESRLPRRTGDKEMSRYRSWYGIVKSSIDLSTRGFELDPEGNESRGNKTLIDPV